jgi:hypothetical protein
MREGKIILNTVNIEESEEKEKTLLELEQYLNNEAALYIFNKWRVGIRVHL